MEKEPLIIQSRARHHPGNVEVVIPQSSLSLVREIEKDRKERLYLGRAHLSSKYDNTRHSDDLIRLTGATLIPLSASRIRVWLDWQSAGVVFTLKSNRRGMLNRIEAYTRASLPGNALNTFKTALYTYLDKLVRDAKCPVYVEGITLLLSRRVLFHEVPITFFAKGRTISDPFGYGNVHWFAPFLSLEREALSSTSPFYRLLCRFRAYEGIGRYLRPELRAFAREIGVTARLPGAPRISPQQRREMGLKELGLASMRNYEELGEQCRQLRNGVAHFLVNKPFKAMLMASRGDHRTAAETWSQLLRISNEKLMGPRWDYFNKWLSDNYNRGKILVDTDRPKDFPALER